MYLAESAAVRVRESHILDTLAEAYYVNGLYTDAARTAEKALQLAKKQTGLL